MNIDIETEKATDQMDLPHAYNEIKMIQRECVCGRTKGDQLHSPAPITEQAAHSAPLETTKGS